MPLKRTITLSAGKEEVRIYRLAYSFLFLVGLALFFLCHNAYAQESYCAQRDLFIQKLSESYHEQPIAVGLTTDGNLVEVLESDKNDSWTILLTKPNGISCMMAVGNSWEEVQIDKQIM